MWNRYWSVKTCRLQVKKNLTSSWDVKLSAKLGIVKEDSFLTSKFKGSFVSLWTPSSTFWKILKFAFVKIYVHSSGFYNCKTTTVIYTCILNRNTRVNSSVGNTFIESFTSRTLHVKITRVKTISVIYLLNWPQVLCSMYCNTILRHQQVSIFNHNRFLDTTFLYGC